jgi:hypothetical protein
VVISVPNMRYVSALATFVLGSEWPEDPLGIFDGTHLQVMTHRRLNRWALQAGLELQRWHDKYDHRFVRRNACRLVNRMTFGFLRSFLTHQVQGVFRRTTTSGIVKPSSPKYLLGTSEQRQSCANTARVGWVACLPAEVRVVSAGHTHNLFGFSPLLRH